MLRVIAPARIAAVACAAVVASVSITARADVERDAASAFEEGAKAFNAGDFAGAAAAFERAYALKPHPSALWNGARARHRMGDPAGAANLYARYLDEAPPGAADRDHALASLNELAKSLARIELHAGEGVSDLKMDGAPMTSDARWVVPGEHTASGRSSAGEVQKVVAVRAGERTSVTLVPAPRDDEATHRSVEPPPSRGGIPWAVSAAGGGATLALAGVAIWSGLDTVDQKEVFDATGSQDDLDEGRRRQFRTNVLFVATGVVGAATIATLFFVDWGPRRSTTTARISFGPTGVAVRAAF